MGGLSGCRSHSEHAVISVDAPVALADRPIHVRVGGLAAGDTVRVTATAENYQRMRWRGWATFLADGRGQVDLDRARPIAGTYDGVDGMGLFWSMNPAIGDPEATRFASRFPDSQPAYPIRLSVSAHGRRLAQRTLTRQWLAPGVTHKTLTLGADKVSGELFLPPPGGRRRPGVLLFGGSEGGNGGRWDGALLASHGYAALSLAYFAEPGLPTTLQDIPLEYFARAARILAAQPGVHPGHIVARGYSRGSEAALLMGQYHPELIHGVIVYAPSSRVVGGWPNTAADAWTRDGDPIPQGAIPLDRIDGSLLAIAGTDDRIWESAASARQIMRELDRASVRFPHQALIYPGAGHQVGTFPYGPKGTRYRSRFTGGIEDLGGSRAADAAAQAQGWPKVLAFLAALAG